MATISEAAPAPVDGPGDRRAVAVLALVTLLAALGTSIANVALPALAGAYSAALPQLQWVVLSYLLAVTGAAAGAGWLADLIGRRRLVVHGLALFVAASILCAAAPTLPLLVAARALQGLGAAAMLALPMAMAAEAAPGKARSAIGLLGAASAAGTAAGPALGGALIALAGWHAVFLLCAAGGAAALPLVARHLPRDAGRTPRPSRSTGGALVKAVLPLAGSLAAAVAASAVIMATLIVGPFYLSMGLAQDVAWVGLITAAGPVVVALTGVPAGRLADRFGARPVALAGLLLMLAGCAALSLLPASTGVPGYLLSVCTITGGYSLFQTGNNSSVLARAQAGRRGLVSGLLTLSRNIGLIAGASLMAGIFAAALGGASPAQAGPALVAAGLRATFAAGAVPILVALAMTWRARRRI